jgi:hypothetical protein
VPGFSGRRAADDGLQPERTALSWSRTSLGVLGNSALLFLRDILHYSGPLRLLPAGLAAVIAVATYLVGRQRQHLLTRRPLPDRLAPRWQIRLIGGSVLVLIVVTALALPV